MRRKKGSVTRVHIKERPNSDGRTNALQLHYHDGRGNRIRESLRIKVLRPEAMRSASPEERAQSRENWDIAEMIRIKTEQELLQGWYNVSTPRNRQQPFIEYLDQCSTEKRGKTKEILNILRNYLIAYAGANFTINHITRQFLEDFYKFLGSVYNRQTKGRGLSTNTKHTIFARLASLLNRAVSESLIHRNFIKDMKIPKEAGQRAYLTTEEVAKFEALREHSRYKELVRAFLFACYCGLRFSDVRALEWGAIEHTEINGKPITFIKFKQQKTQKNSYIPLSNKAINMIGERPAKARQTDRVFRDIGNVSHNNERLKRIAKEAGIQKNISFHVSRHTFAVLSLEKGVDIYSVSKLLGHTNVTTTQIYAKMTDEKMRQAIDILNN